MMSGRAHSEHGGPASMSPDDKASGQEAAAMPLTSLLDVGGWEVGLADHAVLAPNPVVQPAELGGLLSDVLFGEVIDISDLVPRMLSPSAETAASLALPVDPAAGAVPSLGEVLALSGHAEALTILYDDDILASVSGIL
jgi:hypothetical protein